MTAVAVPPPEIRDVTSFRPITPGEPLSSVSADLMPDEIRAKRRLAFLKRRLVFGLVALALVIGLGDALARQQTGAAQDDLTAADQRIAALNQQAARYGQVIGVQSETQQITTLLNQAMAGDVPWASLTATLQRRAPRGLTLTGVDGEVGAGTAAVPPAPAAGGASAPAVVGTLSLTGTASGYRTVASYVSALVSVPGLTGVTPATASTGSAGGSLTFTITASLTAKIFGGRYTTSSSAAPGTAPGASPAAGPGSAAGAPNAPAANPAPTTPAPTAPVGSPAGASTRTVRTGN